MTGSSPKDQSQMDIRLRTILSSWHQNPRYRAVALTRYRSQPVKLASHTDLDRELKGPRYAEWKWVVITLLVLTFLDYLFLPHLD
jgi:hypothetical protein